MLKYIRWKIRLQNVCAVQPITEEKILVIILSSQYNYK